MHFLLDIIKAHAEIVRHRWNFFFDAFAFYDKKWHDKVVGRNDGFANEGTNGFVGSEATVSVEWKHILN
jgi:hypothetical protein